MKRICYLALLLALCPSARPGEAPAKTIPLNLQGANIDTVMKFLSEHTGKAVMKHKDANVTLTLALAKEVPAAEAVSIVHEALRLQGLTVVETDKALLIVPLDKAREVALPPVGEKAAGAPAELATEVVPIKFATADQLKEQFAPLLPKHATLSADKRTNQLIVTATRLEIAHLKKIIGQLDVLDVVDGEIRLFELEHADASQLAEVLTGIFSDGAAKPSKSKGRPSPPRPPQQKGKQAPQPAKTIPTKIVAETRANWLIVSAPPAKLKAIAELVEKLDVELPKEIDVQIYPLEYAEASDLARQIGQLVKKVATGKAEKDTVEVVAHPRSNAILALASQKNQDLIEKIVKALDTEEAEEREAKTFVLKHADAEEVAEQLEALQKEDDDFSYWWFGSRREEKAKTKVVAVPRTNSIIVVAPKTEFKMVEKLVEELDEVEDDEHLPPKVFQIRNADATEMEKILNTLFDKDSQRSSRRRSYFFSRSRSSDKGRDISRLAGKVRFVAEKSLNRIVVIAQSEAVLKIVAELIEELDKADPELTNTTVYQLKHADALEMAQRLNELFAERARPPDPRKTKEGEEPERRAYYPWLMGGSGKKKEEERAISTLIGNVRVVPDVRSNSLIITTGSQHLAAIVTLVEELDKPEPKVLVQTRLVEITRGQEDHKGLRFSPDLNTFTDEDLDNAVRGTGGFTFREAHSHTVMQANIDLHALIQLLLKNTDSKLLSDPTICMNNNQKGEIFVGSDVPFITKSLNTTEGGRNDAFEYRDVGVLLTVTPQINSVSGTVSMKVNLKSSQIRENETLFGGFIIDRREYTTEIAVEDGQTLVMGGIVSERQDDTVRKVPVLGSIPLMGALFRKTDKVVTKTELLAFITPTVLQEVADADRVTKERLDRVDEMRAEMERD